ncbi:MAG: hypothetical protein BGO05_03375 [Rhizobiales bacterium 63-7]|nr:hypothetical protein [Hyphomicrobiales bacterium]OJU68652.1 MAG: hypothetical protein BGO05_03375 [Rhizobiales bacterium 63-7]
MQRKTSAAMCLAGALFACGTTQAADIDQAGADKLKASLTHYLPKDLLDTGFLSVKPATGRYEIVTDIMKLLAGKLPPETTVTGLKPFTVFATPAEKDLWKVEGDGNFDVTAGYKIADAPATMRYIISNYSYTGLFDPAIAYMRNGTFTASGLKLSTTGGSEQIDARFGGMNYVVSSTDAAGGALDFTGSGTLSDFYEKVVSPNTPPVEISADSIAFDATVKGAMLREIRDLVFFVLDNMKHKDLTDAQQQELKAKALAALPFASSIDENIRLNNLNVATAQARFGVKTFDYGLNLSGAGDAMRFGVSMKAADPILPAGLVPPVYASLVPQQTEVSFSMADMKIGEFLRKFLEKADFNKKEPISDAEGAELVKLIFPDGKVAMTFDRIAARAPTYDVEMTGKLTSALENTKQVSMTATVIARNFDATIAAIQEAAKADPQLNQVSFGLMMAKGFAKDDGGGKQRWEVEVREDGSVDINGQQVKGPDTLDEEPEALGTEEPDALGTPEDSDEPATDAQPETEQQQPE